MQEHLLTMHHFHQPHQVVVSLLRLIHSRSRPLISLLIISSGWSANKQSSFLFPLEEFCSEVLSHVRLHGCSADTSSTTVTVSEVVVSVQSPVTALSA